MNTANTVITDSKPATSKAEFSNFASLKLFFSLISVLGITILIGSWCPQEAQVGREKVIEQFGPDLGAKFIQYGISDIFHTPFFLGLIGLLTVNLVYASFQRVFPKLKLLKQPMPWLGVRQIAKMPTHQTLLTTAEPASAIETVAIRLRKFGYKVDVNGSQLTAHWGKFGRIASSVTHVGLLTLLTGVTITSWTGFTGFQPILLHENLDFDKSEHSRMWVGKMPDWKIHVDATRREDYPTGEPMQWYSTLSVIDPKGKVLKTQEISVNNPLTYDGVDIYQSSWGLHGINVSFNGRKQFLQLNQMGAVHAAMLPLDDKTIMIFSVRNPKDPIKVFAKIPEWQAPRILTMLELGKPAKLGAVTVTYDELVPATGLQYKSDPGLPITYIAFGFIICGVLLASIPHRQVWAAAAENGADTELVIGGNSRKGKALFERSLKKIASKLKTELAYASTPAIEAFPCPTSK